MYCPSLVSAFNPHLLFSMCQAHELYCADCHALSGERWHQRQIVFQESFFTTKTTQCSSKEPNDILLSFFRADVPLLLWGLNFLLLSPKENPVFEAHSVIQIGKNIRNKTLQNKEISVNILCITG